MDFGTIKNNFTNILVESYVNGDQKGKLLYKKFLKIIKEDESLKSYFIIYKNIEGKTFNNEFEASEYLKENLNILDKFRGDNGVSFGIKKLRKLLESSGLEINTKPTKLHESLNNLLTSPKNVNTLNLIHESKSDLIKWLTSSKENDSDDKTYVVDGVDPKKFLEIAVDKFNEKYTNLTEEQKNILKVIRENELDQMSIILENLVSENIKLINNNLIEYQDNTIIKEKLLETKDIVYNIKENSDNTADSILKLLQLKNSLSDGE
jgi:hypothetical protein